MPLSFLARLGPRGFFALSGRGPVPTLHELFVAHCRCWCRLWTVQPCGRFPCRRQCLQTSPGPVELSGQVPLRVQRDNRYFGWERPVSDLCFPAMRLNPSLAPVRLQAPSRTLNRDRIREVKGLSRVIHPDDQEIVPLGKSFNDAGRLFIVPAHVGDKKNEKITNCHALRAAQYLVQPRKIRPGLWGL